MSLRGIAGNDTRQGAIDLQRTNGSIECIDPPDQLSMQTQAQLGAIDRQPFFYLPTWRLQLRILMLEIAPLQAIQNTGVIR